MRKDVKKIIEEFDFGKVHDVMTHLNWIWYNEGVPNIAKLIILASELLEKVYFEAEKNREDSFRSTGGFEAEAFYDGHNIKLQLKFVITEFNNF